MRPIQGKSQIFIKEAYGAKSVESLPALLSHSGNLYVLLAATCLQGMP